MPAGLRASLALLFGVFALVTGLVAVDRCASEGTRAGASSACCRSSPAPCCRAGRLAAVDSRKRGGPLWWTVVRRALILVAALFVVYWVVLPVSMAIIATERPRGRSRRPISAGPTRT